MAGDHVALYRVGQCFEKIAVAPGADIETCCARFLLTFQAAAEVPAEIIAPNAQNDGSQAIPVGEQDRVGGNDIFASRLAKLS